MNTPSPATHAARSAPAHGVSFGEALRVWVRVAALSFGLAGLSPESGGDVRRSFVTIVSEEFFRLLGARPVAGRFFNAEESRPNSRIPVIVLSHSFWQRLGGDPALVGRTLRVNDRPYTVIGIAPEAALASEGTHQPAAGRELFEQGCGHVGPARRDHDGVEGCVFDAPASAARSAPRYCSIERGAVRSFMKLLRSIP